MISSLSIGELIASVWPEGLNEYYAGAGAVLGLVMCCTPRLLPLACILATLLLASVAKVC